MNALVTHAAANSTEFDGAPFVQRVAVVGLLNVILTPVSLDTAHLPKSALLGSRPLTAHTSFTHFCTMPPPFYFLPTVPRSARAPPEAGSPDLVDVCFPTKGNDRMKRKEKPMPAKTPCALRKGSVTSKLAKFSPKAEWRVIHPPAAYFGAQVQPKKRFHVSKTANKFCVHVCMRDFTHVCV
eukprot:scaffold22746_cov17-Tisochrysis_lutea.AAC.1